MWLWGKRSWVLLYIYWCLGITTINLYITEFEIPPNPPLSDRFQILLGISAHDCILNRLLGFCLTSHAVCITNTNIDTF